jgi:hypothetical protein
MPADPEAEPVEGRLAEVRLAEHAETLADGVEAALPGWVERSVARRLRDWRGDVPPAFLEQARRSGRAARDEIGPQLRAFLGQDVDEQRTTPLEIVRRAVRFPTAVLAGAGIPPVVRDEVAEARMPDDLYDLVPGAWADVDDALTEAGLTWGAAKAYVVLARRRAEGRR